VEHPHPWEKRSALHGEGQVQGGGHHPTACVRACIRASLVNTSVFQDAHRSFIYARAGSALRLHQSVDHRRRRPRHPACAPATTQAGSTPPPTRHSPPPLPTRFTHSTGVILPLTDFNWHNSARRSHEKSGSSFGSPATTTPGRRRSSHPLPIARARGGAAELQCYPDDLSVNACTCRRIRQN
jgi:hypothetical protein